MKIRDVMTSPAIRIQPEEPVAVAARTLEHYNIIILARCRCAAVMGGCKVS